MRATAIGIACIVGVTSLPARAAAGYTVASPIKEVIAREYGLDVTLQSAGNPMGCPVPVLYRLKLDAQNYQVIAALVLSLYAQGKPLSVYTYYCDGDGASIFVAAR